ncbi:type IV pilin protein [Timonella senegalensis]|uniref:type IV pilin protein n=1 Tax=Timonella senegalensis TaxID=1465825 RepID=UPI002FDD7935
MIARISKSLNEKEKGFTLIELLVVVIIIGILSAIAIPVFMNQRQKAVDAGIKSDLRSIANEVESYYVDNQVYPVAGDVTTSAGKVTIKKGANSPADVTISLSDAATTIVYAPTAGTEAYTITGQNTTKGSKATFKYDSANGGLQSKSEASN